MGSSRLVQFRAPFTFTFTFCAVSDGSYASLRSANMIGRVGVEEVTGRKLGQVRLVRRDKRGGFE